MCALCRISFLPAAFRSCLLLAAIALTPAALAQQAEIETLATKLAQRAMKVRNPAQEKVRVAVFSFSRQDGEITELGLRITGEVGLQLSRMPGLEVITSQQMEQARKAEGWSEQEWTLDSFGFSVAHAAGAEVVIVGSHQKADKTIRVEAQAIQLPKGKKLGSASVRIPLSPELRALDAKSLPIPREEQQSASSSIEELLKRSGALEPGKDGVGEPQCEKCPFPYYTNPAREAKYSAKVLLAVVIDENGAVKDLRVVRAGKYGLTEEAIRVVRNWRFKPATKGGKPVAVATFIEVTFRLL
jgi:TonB family protein